jgi:Protein of unknown function (DUF1425)
MKKILIPLLSLVAALFTNTGCQTETGAFPPQNATKYDLENREKFVLMDRGTQRSITASILQETPLPDGRLQVAANVRNRVSRRIEVQVNCEFKDERGLIIDSTPWQTLVLSENGQETVQFAALNALAKKYTIRLREAR